MSDFLITLAEITLTMSVVILLLLLLGPILARRYAIRWRYWAWLAVAVRLLIPLNFSLPEAPVQLETPPDRVVYTAPPAVNTPPPQTTPANQNNKPNNQEKNTPHPHTDHSKTTQPKKT